MVPARDPIGFRDLDEERADAAYRALANPRRRALLASMRAGGRSVGDLVEATGLEQPIVSQQLRVLRDAGLVRVDADGNRRIYSVEFERIAALRSALDAFWDDRLARLARAAERRAGASGAGEGGR